MAIQHSSINFWPSHCTFVHDPEQQEIQWANMAQPITPLPLTSSRADQIFPTLTSAQIERVATHGRTRTVRSGEVLVEQGDAAIPFFVMTCAR
jgi:hypothetical protein